jgi:DNA-binding GntR family transcriptional regulator
MLNAAAAGDHRRPRRQQLPDEVASYVRELIISGQIRSGEFLRVERITSALGVSSTPVREGLLTLQSEGFIRLVPRRGFLVAPFTAQDLRDLFWTQAQLAGELTARAATQITSEQLAGLERNLDQYEQAFASSDTISLAKLGHLFHRDINLAARSRRLALLLGSIVRQLPNSFYTAIEGHVDQTRQAHPLVLDTLRARQPRQARACMIDHLLDGSDHLIKMLEERGLWSAV